MIKRKDKILITALEILYKEGINGLTTKNIAEHEGVTEPALYRQYKNKKAILDSVITEYSSYDEKIVNTIREKQIKGIEALEFYVRRFAEQYYSYKELTTIMFSMDMFYYEEDTKEQMKNVHATRIAFIEEMLKDYFIENREEKSDVEIARIASLLNGTMIHTVYEWRMLDKEEWNLAEVIVERNRNIIETYILKGTK